MMLFMVTIARPPGSAWTLPKLPSRVRRVTLPLATSTRNTGFSSVSSAVTSRLRPPFSHSIEPTERSQRWVSGRSLVPRPAGLLLQHQEAEFVTDLRLAGPQFLGTLIDALVQA